MAGIECPNCEEEFVHCHCEIDKLTDANKCLVISVGRLGDEIERLRAEINFLNIYNEVAAREWLAEEKEKWKSSGVCTGVDDGHFNEKGQPIGSEEREHEK